MDDSGRTEGVPTEVTPSETRGISRVSPSIFSDGSTGVEGFVEDFVGIPFWPDLLA